MLLERMGYIEVEDYLKKHDTVIITCGSTENHGKHMPLGTDTLIPSRINELADKLLGDEVVTAPALPYGCTEDLSDFAGTISIGMEGLISLLGTICDGLYKHGFRHFIVLNGHGGNSKAIECVGHRLWKKGAVLARLDWWLIAGQLRPEWRGGHRGGEETAGVMGVDPSLIKREYLELGEEIKNDLGEGLPSASRMQVKFKGGLVTVPRPIHCVTDNGWLSHGIANDAPAKATEEWGREMLNTMAEYTADFVRAFAEVPLPVC